MKNDLCTKKKRQTHASRMKTSLNYQEKHLPIRQKQKKLVTIQIRKKREPGNLFIQRKEHLQIANSRDPRDKSLYFPLILCVFSQFFRNSFMRLECSSFQWQWRIIALIEGK